MDALRQPQRTSPRFEVPTQRALPSVNEVRARDIGLREGAQGVEGTLPGLKLGAEESYRSVLRHAPRAPNREAIHPVGLACPPVVVNNVGRK